MSNIIINMKQDNDKAADVKRCLSVLLGTQVGTVALDRDFGIDWSFLDEPTAEAAQAKCAAEVIEKIERYEPRASVDRVTFTGDSSGALIPKVEVSLSE